MELKLSLEAQSSSLCSTEGREAWMGLQCGKISLTWINVESATWVNEYRGMEAAGPT